MLKVIENLCSQVAAPGLHNLWHLVHPRALKPRNLQHLVHPGALKRRNLRYLVHPRVSSLRVGRLREVSPPQDLQFWSILLKRKAHF